MLQRRNQGKGARDSMALCKTRGVLVVQRNMDDLLDQVIYEHAQENHR